MKTSRPLESFREIDQVKERRDNPNADTVPAEQGCEESTLRGNPAGYCDSGEDGFETFMDGAGV
jgi:hypothetical protein